MKTTSSSPSLSVQTRRRESKAYGGRAGFVAPIDLLTAPRSAPMGGGGNWATSPPKSAPLGARRIGSSPNLRSGKPPILRPSMLRGSPSKLPAMGGGGGPLGKLNAAALVARATASPTPAPAAKAKFAWKKASAAANDGDPNSKMNLMIAAAKKEREAQAKVSFQTSMRKARVHWDQKEYAECESHLKVASQNMPNCEVVNRFRFMLRSREGRADEALADAGNAVANGPGNPRNHHALAMASQAKMMLGQAGPAYLTCMSRGLPGTSDSVGFNGFLNTVQRHRQYMNDLRPAHRKMVGSAITLAREPSRGSIFDPEKAFDSAAAEEDLELPDPPQLSLEGAEENSVSVAWYPDTSEGEGITIYAYELQMAMHDVCWEGSSFFDGWRDFETVHKAAANIDSTTIHGLRTDNKYLLRIRAQSFSGFGDWNELVVSTTPPASKMREALPLPRKWLQVDVADLVPLHVLEVGGDPKRFFKELASCFTPHVRTIKRLFTGWSRVGLVGQKSKNNELSRMQFMRFCKEVGLCQGPSPMAKRSGAKILSTNDVDRIFSRANQDTSEMDKSGSRGVHHGSANLGLDRHRVRELAEEALEDLAEDGRVEADAGESELREKLRPLFDQFDEDGSGSVSTDEVGKMAKSLKMEMSQAQLHQLMLDADPDGSGEIEFEELVAVLKKQMKEGGSGGMAALFNIAPADDGDGGQASMVMYEFIHALIRLAWECYAAPNTGMGARLNALLERAVLPGSSHLTDNRDPMEVELASKHVQAITEYYSDQLLAAFQMFAAADVSLNAQAHLETMSFAELIFMAKTLELIDGKLTVAKITEIFARVNNEAADDGEKDDDAEELNFAEFKNCVCRLANAKIPKEDRGTPPEPFEYTWQAFLQLIFVPRAKMAIRNMKKGLVKRNI